MTPKDAAVNALSASTLTRTPSYALKSAISVPPGTIKPAPVSHVTQVMDHPSKVYAARPLSPATLIIANATVTVKLSITTENVSSATNITSSTPIKNASPVPLKHQSTNPSKNRLLPLIA